MSATGRSGNGVTDCREPRSNDIPQYGGEEFVIRFPARAGRGVRGGRKDRAIVASCSSMPVGRGSDLHDERGVHRTGPALIIR